MPLPPETTNLADVNSTISDSDTIFSTQLPFSPSVVALTSSTGYWWTESPLAIFSKLVLLIVSSFILSEEETVAIALPA